MSAAPLLSTPLLQPQEILAQQVPGQGQGGPNTAEAARQFEGMLMAYVFQQMQEKTVQPSGLFGDDRIAQGTFNFLLDQAVSSQAMKSGQSWGLSARLENEWGARKNPAPGS